MSLMIDKMRADFALVTATRVAAGSWEKGDEATAGRAIAVAIERGDDEAVLMWSRWLAKLALQDLMAGSDPSAPAAIDRACTDCRYFVQGDAADASCGGREYLAKLYGKRHPSHVLPADGGVSCARFAKREA